MNTLHVKIGSDNNVFPNTNTNIQFRESTGVKKPTGNLPKKWTVIYELVNILVNEI